MVSNLMQGHFNDVQPTISRFSTVLVIKPYFLHVYQEMDIFHQLYPNNLDMVIGMYVVVLYCSRMMTLLSKNIGACCFYRVLHSFDLLEVTLFLVWILSSMWVIYLKRNSNDKVSIVSDSGVYSEMKPIPRNLHHSHILFN